MAGFDFVGALNQFKLGTGTVGNPDQQFNRAPAAPAPQPNFWGDLGHSVQGVAGGAVDWARNLPGNIGNDNTDFGKGIQQAMPGGTMQAQFKQQQQTRDNLDYMSQQAHDRYSKGLITKDQFTKNLKTIQQGYSDLSKTTQDQASQYITPRRFIETLPTVAGEALGVGGLVRTAVGSAGLAGAEALGRPLFGAATEGGGIASKAAKVADAVLGSGTPSPVKPGIMSLVKGVAAAPLKYAAIERPAVQSVVQAGQDVADHQYGNLAKDAAILGTTAVVGKYGGEVLGKAGSALSTAMFGKAGVLDAALGSRVAKFTAENPGLASRLKQMEQFTLNQPAVKSGSVSAGDFLATHLKSIGVDPKTASLNDIVNNFGKYAKAVDKLSKSGATGLVVSADFRDALPQVTKALANIGDVPAVEREAIINKALDKAGIQNPTVRTQLMSAFGNANSALTAEDLKPIIQKIAAPLPSGTLPKGFIATYAPKETAKLPSLAESTGALTLGKEANPVLGKVGTTLTKAGLSPLAQNTSAVRATVRDNFKQEVDKIPGLEGQGSRILNKLNDAAGLTKGISDPRLFKVDTIGKILAQDKISPDVAKQVRSALDKAMTGAGFEGRGAGQHMVDVAIQKVPGMRQYLKAQSYGKFALNPFFGGKVVLKNAILAEGEATGLNIGKASAEGNAWAKARLTGTPINESEADFLGGMAPRAKSGIVGAAQQNMAANMVDKLAANSGKTVAQIKAEGGPLADQINSAIDGVFGYHKGYLTSNLANTLNVMVFPSKFNTKVIGAGVKFLAKQPPITRAVLINHLLDAQSWAKSPEGQKWQQDNSELMGLIKYFTPLHTLDGLMSFVDNGHHIGDLGEIGGMPVGIINQVLQNQGVNTGVFGQSDYHNPKTGAIVPDKIPQTTKARLQQGATDLISSMFGWPGRQAGLESKTNLIQNNVPFLKPDKGSIKYGAVTKSPSVIGSAISSARVVNPSKVPALPKATIAPVYKPGKIRKGKTLAKHL